MLSKPDRKQFEAMARLRASQDFNQVRHWLEVALEELDKQNRITRDDVDVRWRQGGCQALQDILKNLGEASKVVKAR